jgi:porin
MRARTLIVEAFQSVIITGILLTTFNAGATFAGWQKEAAARGITLELTYTGEAFRSFGLVPDDTTRYRGLLDLALRIDTGTAGLWPGGELFVVGQNGHGQGFVVEPVAGLSLPITDIDAQNFTEISQYGLSQSFLKGSLNWRVGKQDVNDIFCVNTVGGDFAYPSYTLIPTVPMPTFPAPAVGTAVFFQPVSAFSLGFGFYDGDPEVETPGIETFFHGSGGYFFVLEPTWEAHFGKENGYEVDYRLGLWYHTGEFPATGKNTDAETFTGNYGLYVLLDQMVYRRGTDGRDDQGLSLFFQAGWAPNDRNQVTQYMGAGLAYQGIFPSRRHDILGVGVNYSLLLGSGADDGSAGLVNAEIFYKAELTPWISVQPDVQYFSRTSENGTNGLGAGIRWNIHF